MEKYQLTYHVDMVFCIDATGSMRHVLDFVKQNALSLYQDVCGAMDKKHKVISQMRIRVIAFRDYVADGDDAMRAVVAGLAAFLGDVAIGQNPLSQHVEDGHQGTSSGLPSAP